MEIDAFIEHWRQTGGSELANTQSFINGLCAAIGVPQPDGSKPDDAGNDYVFERRVFQDNGDGSQSFGRIDCYKRDSFIMEAKQGSDADRTAAARGEADLDLFGQTASARMKRGTARRGTPGWARAMLQAKGQAERYARALPADHGWPPFLLVADIGYCIEVYADFTGTGRAYAQFPDRARYRIMLEDLREPDVRERLRAIWTEPRSLDPAIQSTKVTREIAALLAKVSRRLEARGHDATKVSGFLMRVLFTMFAEDTDVLLPRDSFKTLLREHTGNPQHLHHSLSALWGAMDRGEFAPALRVPVKRFNGYLFKDTEAIPLEPPELQVLIEAADKDWRDVEPAIFGTLLERALSTKDRSALGAHFTPRAYVERLVSPTIMEPLRADWDGVRVAVAALIQESKPGEAKRMVEAFHAKLAITRVLDPACGTGNFLYVAMARMKELEGEVLDLLIELGDDQYLAEITGHTITPDNFLGIEINPRAAAIAQLVLWIGYLQWHFRVNGPDRSPPEPILRDIRTIEARDALIAYDALVLDRDEHGRPVTRWDGETMKVHTVTGREVPDEDARVEVYRYENPVAAPWPQADFIVGNPPFHGARTVRGNSVFGYIEAVRSAYPDVPEHADFVMYWWHRGALELRSNAKRFGFVTTNSIVQTFSRRVVEKHLSTTPGVSIVFAVPDHPWIDEKDGASVRIAMTVCELQRKSGRAVGTLCKVSDESQAPDRIVYSEFLDLISSDLRVGADVTTAKPLRANEGLASVGYQLTGNGFVVTDEFVSSLSSAERDQFIRPLIGGREIVQRGLCRSVVDACHLPTADDLRVSSPSLYQHLLSHVKPERDQNARQAVRERWWVFGEARNTYRPALNGLASQIVTPITSKHRVFVKCDGLAMPDSNCVMIASSDDFVLGVLSSRIHLVWAKAAGGTLEDRPRYLKGACFDPFPFPSDVLEPLKDRIGSMAEALDALRKHVLAEHDDLTLTRLYNVLEVLRANGGKGHPLTPAERDIHDRGLVTLIREHHEAIDTAVAEAYGWPADLSDEDLLVRLVSLNHERTAEEAKGRVRWLRPTFQNPKTGDWLDTGSGVKPAKPAPTEGPVKNVLLWPDTLPQQVSAVHAVLASAPAPLAPQDVARAFKGKRASTVRPVLDALADIGKARRLGDGRFAA